MKVTGLTVCCLAVLAIYLASGRADQRASAPASKPATGLSSSPADKIVATVNGQPIYESELMAAMPEDAFQEQLDDMKKAKLKRLVEETVQAQFLRDRKIAVSDDEVTKAIRDFEKNVMTPGCPCCGGGYESLAQFMKINAFSAAEIRRRVSNDIGLKIYVERLAKERAASQPAGEAAKNRTKIEADYATVYMMAFDCMRDPNFYDNRKEVEGKKAKLANDALLRLKKGEAFEKVAKEVSEDAATASKGGALGCIRIDAMGPEVEQVLRKLEPDKYSSVVKPQWGYCIVMKKKLTEEDIVAAAEEQAKGLAEDYLFQEYKAARERAEIRYVSSPATSVSVPD
jgi:hypothetical protein